jgi:hypothetical protein
VVACLLELSNDEVYYYLYALDIQPNYFDHPPGVGALIRISTGDLFITHEFFVRLGALVCAIFGTIFTYQLGKLLKNERTGFYAALLYNTSIYTSIIAGTFIIPDSPQVVLWLGAMWIMYRIIVNADLRLETPLSEWLLFGLVSGLCVLCKVHGIFLWFGFGLYILFFQYRLLTSYGLYLSMLVTIVVISPILWWNIQNDFITYRFHSERVSENVLHMDYFLQTFGGQLLYSNPVNSVLIFIAFWKLTRVRILDTTSLRFIILNGLPIILVVTVLSLFNPMLPHWSGPGFMTLAFLAAAWLDEVTAKTPITRVPVVIKASGWLVVIALVAALGLIKFYPGTFGSHEKIRYGDGDFTLDMYGWRQFSNEFQPWFEEQRTQGALPADVKIVVNKWFPAAHLDYYVAEPLRIPVIGVGELKDLHHYYWLNKDRPQLKKGDDAICILPSNYQVMDGESYSRHFSSYTELAAFENTRSGELARYFYVYLLHDYLANDEAHNSVSLDSVP